MRDVHTRRLRYALAVADARSVTRAARSLHLSQQGLSQQLQRLEADLGFPLFDRTARGVEVTAAGERYLTAAREALALLTGAARAARPASTLRVGFLTGAAAELTDPILDAFATAQPTTRVELVEQTLADTSAGLRDGNADVAFVRAPMTETGLQLLELFAEPRVVAMAAGHPLAARARVEPQDLAGLPLIGAPTEDPVFAAFWSLADASGADGPHVVRTVASIPEELQLVARGDEVSITATSAARFFPRPGVVYRSLEACASSRVCLAWRTGDHGPAVLAFRECAQAVLQVEQALIESLRTATPQDPLDLQRHVPR